LNDKSVAIIYFTVTFSRFTLHIGVYIFHFCYFGRYIICIMDHRGTFLVLADSFFAYSKCIKYFEDQSISCEASHLKNEATSFLGYRTYFQTTRKSVGCHGPTDTPTDREEEYCKFVSGRRNR
jgi:hypothetical protein